MPKGNFNLLASIRLRWKAWPIVLHSARTAVAAVVSVAAARLVRLPEAYWAPVTTLVITQSSLGAAFCRFSPAFRRHCPRRSHICRGGHLLWFSRGCLRRQRLPPWHLLRACALGSNCLSLWRGDVGNRAADTEGRAPMDDRVPSLCRSVHRNRGGSALRDDLAGRGRRRRGELMNFL